MAVSSVSPLVTLYERISALYSITNSTKYRFIVPLFLQFLFAILLPRQQDLHKTDGWSGDSLVYDE
ncbi:hypothetical protein TREMEDRAFT_67607 [Tremella mesenterica DSM 1558]|uniref:uncharacterized protein n=1 Tax=Tremella mesenterica (strain ATCC 24925 / CBS 8224 / DSM 1558 / NBRC 9311 / NRRL Y-6157 / RJB 2259-6 / UBC 559-6) TaxID=578456 RepID=UPI0003F4A326|nr:uncharacterized protein TREMEDRAFT_67607 [Tremella mesenterica DSM 1558]EIW71168.1 hypothetical protein TREMEDRAFT_67607 [Tremella mesenterica DSM 1558]